MQASVSRMRRREGVTKIRVWNRFLLWLCALTGARKYAPSRRWWKMAKSRVMRLSERRVRWWRGCQTGRRPKEIQRAGELSGSIEKKENQRGAKRTIIHCLIFRAGMERFSCCCHGLCRKLGPVEECADLGAASGEEDGEWDLGREKPDGARGHSDSANATRVRLSFREEMVEEKREEGDEGDEGTYDGGYDAGILDVVSVDEELCRWFDGVFEMSLSSIRFYQGI